MEIEGVKLRHKYYFIDESGDPNFYDKDGRPLEATTGFQPYFILGMVETFNRVGLRNRVRNFIKKIRRDVLYNSIPSIAGHEDWFVHARKDHPEVRINFIELLRKLKGISTHVLIVNKSAARFKTLYGNNSNSLYRESLHRLFTSKNFEKGVKHIFYVSQFGNNQIAFLNEAVSSLRNEGVIFEFNLVSSKKAPEMSVIDYLLWMVNRKLMKGETRFFNALKDKFGVVMEL